MDSKPYDVTREQQALKFALPASLNELLASGIWPNDAKTAMGQNLRSVVAAERVRRFAAEEDQIYLHSPPFRTIADEVASASPIVVDEFWKVFGALDQIVPEKALVIGDFGLGSDAPIILDYARDSFDPPVLRLRYCGECRTDWVQGARNFAEFATILGFCQKTRGPSGG
jgi:hypothetical protein